MSDRRISRRRMLQRAAQGAAALTLAGCGVQRNDAPNNAGPTIRSFDVRDYGALGDGRTLDTAAIQRAIDAAAFVASAATPARVVVPGKVFLIGTLRLRSNIDFHLESNARLLVSTDPKDYQAGAAAGGAASAAALVADDVVGLTFSGEGTIDGRWRDFMDQYDDAGLVWTPKGFRPRLMALTGCKGVEIREITMANAPMWTLYLLGCAHVVVDGVKIRNQLDVPSCNGIFPDGCGDVEIKNCDIVSGDDAIVIKTTRTTRDFGPCGNIHVRDCVIQTQSAGLKIGSESTRDITDVSFERCVIKSSCRGIGIQLRDAGNISKILFKDIQLKAQYFSDTWWGNGEPIALTAMPRTAGSTVGTLRGVRLENITAAGENSVRIDGSADSRIKDVVLENVAVTLDRREKNANGVFDNRPTSSQAGLEQHGTPGFFVRHADGVRLEKCSVKWGENVAGGFSYALEAEDVTGLEYPDFAGEAAHPDKDKAVVVR